MQLELKLGNKFVSVVFICILSALLIMRDVFLFSINKFVYFAVCAVFLIAVDATTMFSLLSFLLPLMCGLPSTYVLLMVMVILILRNRMHKGAFGLCVLFAVLEILALSYVNMPLSAVVIGQILFICTFFMMLYTTEKVDYVQSMKMYFMGTILLSLVVDVYTLMRAPSDWMTLFAKGWYRFGSEGLEGIEGMTLRLNPISLGMFCTSGVLIGFVLMACTKGLRKISVFCGIGILTTTAILAVSRSFVLVVTGCLMLMAFSRMLEIQHIKKVSLAICGIGILGAIAYKMYPQIFEAMIGRMTDSTMAGGNGRVELIVEYAAALLEDAKRMLTGTGATYSRIAINADYSIHNATLQILLSYGIWGGIVFIAGMLIPVFCGKKRGKAEFIFWIPFIGTFIYMQTIQFLNPCYLMMPYVIAVYAVKEGRQQRIS